MSGPRALEWHIAAPTFCGWQRFEQTPPVGAYTTPDRISPAQPATQACHAAVCAFQPPKSKFSSRSARRAAQRPPTALCAASVVAVFARDGVSSEPAGWSVVAGRATARWRRRLAGMVEERESAAQVFGRSGRRQRQCCRQTGSASQRHAQQRRAAQGCAQLSDEGAAAAAPAPSLPSG